MIIVSLFVILLTAQAFEIFERETLEIEKIAVQKMGVPTAIFHGLNDNCTNNRILTENLSKVTGGAYVKCIEVGDGRRTSWWTELTI